MRPANETTVLLRNARIVLPEQVAQSANLVIEDGRIARIFDANSERSPATDSDWDLTGLTLFPGLIDVHIHGAAGVDTMDAGTDDLRRVGEFLVRNGVTAWLPTLVPSAPEKYQQAIRVITEVISAQAEELGPSVLNADKMSAPPAATARVLGVHYEGPFVNNEQCGALHREHFRTFKNSTDIDGLPAINHQSAIHLMTLAPEIDGGIELISELRRRGWIVSIGHTRATVEVLDEALEAGAHHMTHFMNAMPPLHHRAPGPVGWGLTRDEVTCDVIADGVHLDPLVLKLILRTKTSKRISLISDAIAATGLGDGEYRIWGEQITVKDGRTRNAKGSIAGSVITMHDAARMMLSLGASESDVARMTSLNPARLLGIDQHYGSIEVGKRADLVALDSERNVRVTIIAGQVMDSQE